MDEIPAPSAHLSLPQDLIECAAGLSVKGEGQGLEGGSAVERLADAMARIASVSADVEAALKEIKELLEVSLVHRVRYMLPFMSGTMHSLF